MNICHVKQLDNQLLLSGPISFSNAMQCYQQVTDYLVANSSLRQINLSAVHCDDSAILACLVLWRKYFNDICYVNCPTNIQEVLTLSDLSTCLGISPAAEVNKDIGSF